MDLIQKLKKYYIYIEDTTYFKNKKEVKKTLKKLPKKFKWEIFQSLEVEGLEMIGISYKNQYECMPINYMTKKQFKKKEKEWQKFLKVKIEETQKAKA